MIITADKLLRLPEFKGQSEETIKDMLSAVEYRIRAYTNNNFQNRAVRLNGASLVDKLLVTSPYLKKGDTVQITKSQVNDGLYTIKDVGLDFIRIDGTLYNVPNNLITKVEYPQDVKQGVIDLMKWEMTNRDKVGLKSETISRHSVTYYDQDVNNSVMGYPVSLMGFLKPYMKVRF